MTEDTDYETMLAYMKMPINLRRLCIEFCTREMLTEIHQCISDGPSAKNTLAVENDWIGWRKENND